MNISLFPTLAMKNRSVVEKSTNVGCYHCLKIFSSKDIKEYTDDGKTVICPLCEIDAIVGDNNVPELCEEILKKANHFWFKKP